MSAIESSPLRIAFAGTPDFAVPALNALLASHHTVAGVLTQPDRPKGRGRQIAFSPVKRVALDRVLPLSQPQTLKTEAGRVELAGWQPDVLVVVAYGLILPPAVLDLPRLGCINIHGSLLPRWRGAAPIQRAILAGDVQTGVTIMRMDAGLDTGPVLLQRQMTIDPHDTAASLQKRLAAMGASALLEALQGVAHNTAHATPQPREGITHAPKIDKSEALINWSHDALTIERQVRAFNPWPVAETRLEGEQVRIYGAHLDAGDDSHSVDGDHPAEEPGRIVAVRDDALVVACGRGWLALTELQRPGRRPISAREFTNRRALAGHRLG